MKQTQTYKFDLVERGDVFSPDPLNQNMEKVEAQFDAARAEAAAGDAAVTAAFQAADSALDQRVVALEAHRIVVGTYVGKNVTGGQHIELGFTPAAVLFMNAYEQMGFALQGRALNGMAIEEGGFRVSQNGTDQINSTGSKYGFIALL